MEKLFQKYLNSSITPGELDQLMNYINQEENTAFVFEWMNQTWKQFHHNPDVSHANPALLQKIQQVILLEEKALAKKRRKLYFVDPRITPVLLTGQLFANVWLYEQNIKPRSDNAHEKSKFCY